MTENPTLSPAIAYLGAVEVAPGRYAYRDDAARRYYVVSADDLARLPLYLDAAINQRTTPLIDIPYAGGYSEWCADTRAVQMPGWWTPERRFAVRLLGDILGVYVRAGTSAARALECSLHAEAITVNLETGEEIPA